jgi:regulator of sigma E protease
MKALLVLAGLSVLALVHELAHAAAARAFAMRVTSFSFGLGPPLLRRRWGAVALLVGPIPFGGYVRVAEMTPEHAGAGRFRAPAILARLLVILAGPTANYLLAATCATIIGLGSGLETGRILGLEVTAVSEQAAESGLRVGDVLVAVEDRPIERIADLSPALEAASGGDARLRVLREGGEIHLMGHPQRAAGRWGLGARYIARPELRRAELRSALGFGLAYPIVCSVGLLQSGARLLVPNSDVRIVSPVGLADRVARSGAWDVRRVLSLAALMSVVVGLFNLLPVPGLDGGRLCLESVEGIMGRRVAPRSAMAIQLGAVVLLALLWLWVSVRDVASLLR